MIKIKQKFQIKKKVRFDNLGIHIKIKYKNNKLKLLSKHQDYRLLLRGIQAEKTIVNLRKHPKHLIPRKA